MPIKSTKPKSDVDCPGEPKIDFCPNKLVLCAVVCVPNPVVGRFADDPNNELLAIMKNVTVVKTKNENEFLYKNILLTKNTEFKKSNELIYESFISIGTTTKTGFFTFFRKR